MTPGTWGFVSRMVAKSSPDQDTNKTLSFAVYLFAGPMEVSGIINGTEKVLPRGITAVLCRASYHSQDVRDKITADGLVALTCSISEPKE